MGNRSALELELIEELKVRFQGSRFMDKPLRIVLSRGYHECIPDIVEAFSREVEWKRSRLSEWSGHYEDLDHMCSSRVIELSKLGIVEMIPWLVRLLAKSQQMSDGPWRDGEVGDFAAEALERYPVSTVLAHVARSNPPSSPALRRFLWQLYETDQLFAEDIPVLLTMLASATSIDVLEFATDVLSDWCAVEATAPLLALIDNVQQEPSSYDQPADILKLAVKGLLDVGSSRGLGLLAGFCGAAQPETRAWAHELAEEYGVSELILAAQSAATIDKLAKGLLSSATPQAPERTAPRPVAVWQPGPCHLYSLSGLPLAEVLPELDAHFASPPPMACQTDLHIPDTWDWMASRWQEVQLLFSKTRAEDRSAFVEAVLRRIEPWPNRPRSVYQGDLEELFKGVDCGELRKLWPLYRCLSFSLHEEDGPHFRDTCLGLRLLVSRQDVSNIRGILIWGSRDPSEDATLLCQTLASLPQFSNLEKLQLSGCGVTNDGLQILAEAPHLRGVRHLNLCNNRIDDRGVQCLLEAAYPRLTRLSLTGNDAITPAVYSSAMSMSDRSQDRYF